MRITPQLPSLSLDVSITLEEILADLTYPERPAAADRGLR